MKWKRHLKDGIEYFFIGNDGTSHLWIGDDGKVQYSLNGKKTEFALDDCKEYLYCDANKKLIKITNGTDDVDTVTLAVLVGEERLFNNSNQTETRRHESFDDLQSNDTALVDKSIDIEEAVIHNADIKMLLDAIDSLKSDERKLLYELYLDKHTVTQAEYAKKAGLSEQYVKLKAWRTREKLRKLLKNMEN